MDLLLNLSFYRLPSHVYTTYAGDIFLRLPVMRVAFSGKWVAFATLIALLTHQAAASLGDRLPDFRECVKVSGHFSRRERKSSDLARYAKLRTVKVVKLVYVSSMQAFLNLPNDVQRFTSDFSSGHAQLNATIPANMSSLTVD